MSFPLPQVEKSRNDKVKVTRRNQVKVTHPITTAVYTQLLITLCIVLAIIGKRIFLDFRRPATGHANLVSGVGSAEMDRSSG